MPAMKRSLGAKTILCPTPVLVVGTYDAEGKPNVMTAAWGGIACSKPPCVSISLRAATASHGNIMARRAFTISVPGEKDAVAADYFGLVSGRDHNKLADAGLDFVASELVDAPYIAEFPLVLECSVVAVHELGLHTQFIGEIADVKIDDALVDEAGHIDVERLAPIMFSASPGAYYGISTPLGKAYTIGKSIGPRGNADATR